MDRGEFDDFFAKVLDRAAERAEKRLGRPTPRTYLVELYLRDHQGSLVKPKDAATALYLGPDKFYRIIDVAVCAVRADSSIIFVRPSGHAPVTYSETYDPADDGPFKQMDAQTIEIDAS